MNDDEQLWREVNSLRREVNDLMGGLDAVVKVLQGLLSTASKTSPELFTGMTLEIAAVRRASERDEHELRRTLDEIENRLRGAID